MAKPGAPDQPLRVAIIGSGPSGFYAADHLLKQKDLQVEIDLFDRLPTPFGLVRGGVAPDHQKIKTVTKAYDKTASNPGFRFYGNVEYGRDISREELHAHYHAVIYAVGAQTDRRLGVPGEDLAGSHPATEFVGWFNAHPDYRDLTFDLTQETAVVIGNGNVAMDVVRILARTPEELAATDIGDHALEALRQSRVKDIYIVGRRGPGQAAFTNPEVRELGEMADAEPVISAAEVAIDPATKDWLATQTDRTHQSNVDTLTGFSTRSPAGKKRRIHFRFYLAPVEILGSDRVEAIKFEHNRSVRGADGLPKVEATGETEILPAGLVFRSIGYLGLPVPGLPFDGRKGVLPNDQGRVFDPETKQPLGGDYAVGWIKRGPTGVIGTNKPDAQESADRLLEDLASDRLVNPAHPTRNDVESMLRSRGVRFVSWSDWQRLDQMEIALGKPQNRPRVKFDRIASMLDALEK